MRPSVRALELLLAWLGDIFTISIKSLRLRLTSKATSKAGKAGSRIFKTSG
jgi:hypothetical protein